MTEESGILKEAEKFSKQGARGLNLGKRCHSSQPITRISTGKKNRCAKHTIQPLFIVIAPGWHVELYATKLKSEITRIEP